MRSVLPLDALQSLIQSLVRFYLLSRLVATALGDGHETGREPESWLRTHRVMGPVVEDYVHDVVLVGSSDLSHCTHVHNGTSVSVQTIHLTSLLNTFREGFCIAIP